MSLADELQKLQQLHQSGAISDEEFAKAKAHLLDSALPLGATVQTSPDDVERQSRQWAMFLHLSQLVVLWVPPFGLVVPILIWQLKKDELPEIDEHGKVVVNWILSEILYGIGCGLYLILSSLLSVIYIGIPLLLVGVPLLMALGIVAVVFPIVGGIKANNGEIWPYPLSIRFLK